MKNFEIVAILFLIVLIASTFMYYKNETFTSEYSYRYGPFEPVDETRLVDPLVCYPGTYWRNKSYKNICKRVTMERPMRLTTEGKSNRIPEPRYEMVCNPDQRGNRNCQMVKVYDQYV